MRITLQSWLMASALSALLAACAGDEGHRATLQDDHTAQPGGAAASTTSQEALKLAEELRQTGAEEEAFAVLAAAHRRNPDEPDILSAFGRQAVIVGRDALAKELLTRALASNPEDWRALSAQAVLVRRQGRTKDARRAFLRAQTLSRDDAGVLNNLGVTYLIEGDAARATWLFRQALILPGVKQAYARRIKQNLAVALAVQGEFEKAERLAGRSLPRSLQGANSWTVAEFMGLGLTSRSIMSASGWTARIADASEFVSLQK